MITINFSSINQRIVRNQKGGRQYNIILQINQISLKFILLLFIDEKVSHFFGAYRLVVVYNKKKTVQMKIPIN